MKKSLVRLLLLVPIVVLVGCYSGATPNPTPPDVFILKFERNPDGSRGPQTQVKSGGKVTLPFSWLGPNGADIRVYTEEYVREFTVTGTGKGKCHCTDSNRNDFDAPYPLPVSLPTHVETAPSGTVRNMMVFHLDPNVLTGMSCGTHAWNGPIPAREEYFMGNPVTWTITATGENASGLKTTGTFTIEVQ